MAVNRGKDFEHHIKEAFEKVVGVSIDRLHDQTTGFKGSVNICDFIVYKEPYEYYIECKSTHLDRLNFSNITATQWRGLTEKAKIEGVFAGIICWWVDRDVTKYIPIQYLQSLVAQGKNSIRFDDSNPIEIKGVKKRVFFEYDMREFFNDIQTP